ncbi:MAG TPA: hypothetical protein VFJ19_07975 [Nocardioidaceae bacterium]|nr:hypothetical protein [Nocardioidaceae bacterium]
MQAPTSTRAHRFRLATALAGTGLLVAACGGTSAGSTTASGGSQGGSGDAQAAASGSTAVTVETHMGPMGTYLTDGDGNTLYVFAKDKGGTSTCTATCAHFWPPLTTTSAPQASGQVQSGALGTSKRDDGTKQVTYHGHPLYHFLEDKSPGDTKGQGKNLEGGLWWVVAPSGNAITKKGNAQSSPTSGSDAGGSWS